MVSSCSFGSFCRNLAGIVDVRCEDVRCSLEWFPAPVMTMRSLVITECRAPPTTLSKKIERLLPSQGDWPAAADIPADTAACSFLSAIDVLRLRRFLARHQGPLG